MKSRQLRATGTRFFACSLAVVAVVAALSFCGPQRRLHAQPSPPPPWPSTDRLVPQHCFQGESACTLCSSTSQPPPIVGCTSEVPYTWFMGSCRLTPQGTCDTSTFDCGAQLTCNDGMPDGQFCYKGPICK